MKASFEPDLSHHWKELTTGECQELQEADLLTPTLMVEFLCVRDLHVWAEGLVLFKSNGKKKKRERSLHQPSFGLVVISGLLQKEKIYWTPISSERCMYVIWCMSCAQRAMALWRQMADWTPLTNYGYETTETSCLYRLQRCTFTFISPRMSCNWHFNIPATRTVNCKFTRSRWPQDENLAIILCLQVFFVVFKVSSHSKKQISGWLLLTAEKTMRLHF